MHACTDQIREQNEGKKEKNEKKNETQKTSQQNGNVRKIDVRVLSAAHRLDCNVCINVNRLCLLFTYKTAHDMEQQQQK